MNSAVNLMQRQRDVQSAGKRRHPTTVLIDREGREIARHIGPAEWDTSDMARFFRQQLSRKSGALRPDAANDPAVSATQPRTLRPVNLDLPFTTQPVRN